MRRALAAAGIVLVAACASCGRGPARSSRGPSGTVDSSVANAIARDRPERLVLPLAPAGSGRVSYERAAASRAGLDSAGAATAYRGQAAAVAPAGEAPGAPLSALPPPAAEPGEPPASPEAAATEAGALQLKPPIPRSAPRVTSGGRGGRVTLDVRVDEQGEVSDVELVESDADSLTVRAATEAALAQRYFPALLGGRRVAVWTRQVFDVARGR